MSQELSGQWTVPVLLALDSCRGRFTPMQHHLEITPARLSDNLKRMEENGLLKHLSPHERRHPALPEYVLTEKGLLYREAASTIQIAERGLGYGRLSSKAWNLSVLLALNFEHERFQEIRNALQRVTPRTLSMRLDELHNLGAIDKLITDQPRPSFLYQLHSQAKQPVRQLSVDLRSIV
ncbi:winged helix-turn-helix transcriptional regulator [Paenibacillus mendelii]|uniref:Winged helix-turn-helix transcriptional regulator n=1 Tax=Paenibacillus mendelii TaxID=206163 RepID=A0ABV6JKH8_9BACL|nr:winged helix-turn-helix transcriptional regulator [Paenibacillus mendelii]MCQ6563056.1 winged helix-turn-helix transcriptional regulator [Paenibacillus mendelii]